MSFLVFCVLVLIFSPSQSLNSVGSYKPNLFVKHWFGSFFLFGFGVVGQFCCCFIAPFFAVVLFVVLLHFGKVMSIVSAVSTCASFQHCLPVIFVSNLSFWFCFSQLLASIICWTTLTEASIIVLSSPRKGSPLSCKWGLYSVCLCLCLSHCDCIYLLPVSPQVWLSISSKPSRRLVLNWHRLDHYDMHNSWVALYDHEPSRYNFDYAFMERVYPSASSGKFM